MVVLGGFEEFTAEVATELLLVLRLDVLGDFEIIILRVILLNH